MTFRILKFPKVRCVQ